MEKIIQGNLNQNDPKRRGWFAGNFMDEDSPFKTDDFELQWRKLKAGEEKPNLGTQKVAKTMGILVYGKFEFNFPKENKLDPAKGGASGRVCRKGRSSAASNYSGKKITLEKEGEFVFFDAGVAHSWKVIEDTLLVSIRWPSIPGDQK